MAVLVLCLCTGFSLVAATLLQCAGFSLWWLLLLRSTGSRVRGLQQLWLPASRAQAQ